MIDLSSLFLSLDEEQGVEREIQEETSTGDNVIDTNLGDMEPPALEAEAISSPSPLTSSSSRFGIVMTTTCVTAVVTAVLYFL